MPPCDDPLARLHGRAVFKVALESYWDNNPIIMTRPAHMHPKIGGKPIDLYILFEAVRGLGGIARIGERKLYSQVRQILHIPISSSTSPASQIRYLHQRYFAPCIAPLADTVEAAYHHIDLYSPHADWVDAHIDHPKPPSPSPLLPPSSSNGERAAAADPTHQERPPRLFHIPMTASTEDRAFLACTEYTQAAFRARMTPNHLDPMEESHQLFHGMQSWVLRLDLRNHILRMWYRNTTERLSIHTALSTVPTVFHDMGTRVYTFLECTGAINFGAIPLMTPFNIRRSIQADTRKMRICIIGSGITGLIAGRQLRSFGFAVTVFEGRNRPGGRIQTDTEHFSAPVDLGAMIITGVLQNPASIIAEQTNTDLYVIKSACPLFDTNGSWVEPNADRWSEQEYNAVLSATARYRMKENSIPKVESMSLGVAFQKSLIKRSQRRKDIIERLRASEENGNSSPGGIVVVDSPREPVRRDTFGRYVSKKVVRKEMGPEDCAILIPRKKEKRERASYGKHSSEVMKRASYPKVRLRRSDRLRASVGAEVSTGTRALGSLQKQQKNLLKKPLDENLCSRLLRWHIANLEYACAAPIDRVSLKHWDQDDPYSMTGEHVLLKQGFGPLVSGLMDGLERNVHFRTEVTDVRRADEWSFVLVDTVRTTEAGEEKAQQQFDAVLTTVPLGVLKDGSLKFHPPLPAYKQEAINRLGTGGLMKVALEFGHQFWDETDMFGALRESVEERGSFYCFWSLANAMGKPILLGMVAEPHAQLMEEISDTDIAKEAMKVLRRRFAGAPDPIATVVTRWWKDRFARGAYTHIPVGSSGMDYDLIARPIEPYLYFAGEHTCRKNPTTCASGIISGLREAHRILQEFGMIEAIYDMHTECLKASLQCGDGEQDTKDMGGVERKLNVQHETGGRVATVGRRYDAGNVDRARVRVV